MSKPINSAPVLDWGIIHSDHTKHKATSQSFLNPLPSHDIVAHTRLKLSRGSTYLSTMSRRTSAKTQSSAQVVCYMPFPSNPTAVETTGSNLAQLACPGIHIAVSSPPLQILRRLTCSLLAFLFFLFRFLHEQLEVSVFLGSLLCIGGRFHVDRCNTRGSLGS